MDQIVLSLIDPKINAFRNTFNKVDVDGSGEINMQVCSTP